MSNEESQESRINKTIPLRKECFARSQGIFNDVHLGQITNIVKRFNKKASEEDPSNDSKIIQSQNDILQLLIERDELGRTPLDVAW